MAEKLSSTLKNLFALSEQKIITPNYIALYVLYKLHEGEPFATKKAATLMGLSTTAITHMTQQLEIGGLIIVERTPGSAKRVYVNQLSSSELDSLLNSKALSSIYSYKDKRINKYHTKKSTLRHSLIEKTELFSSLPEEYRLLVKHMPEGETLIVYPNFLARLQRLVGKHDINLEHYIKWFMKKKLHITVHTLNTGILVYEPLIEEYVRVRWKMKVSDKYKKVTTRNKKKFEEQAKQLEEEFDGN